MYRKLIYVISFILVINLAGITLADLVAHLRFDEGSGYIAYDTSGNGNDGTLHGNPLWVSGKIGDALDLDGNGDYVEIPRIVQDDFTLAAWIKTDTPGLNLGNQGYQGSGLIWSDVGGTANDFLLAVLGTKLSFFCGNPDTSVNSDKDIVTGQWVHVAATRNAQDGQISIYINGQNENTINHSNNGPLNANDIIAIGGNVLDSRYYTGLIDDVRFYDHVLSQTEIQNAMEGELWPYALGPNPADGVLYANTWATFSWIAGGYAASHDVYMGDNFDDVNEATHDSEAFRGNQALNLTFTAAGFTGYPYPDGLVPGTTYYWRIDEVNDVNPDGPWKGDIWSFTIPSNKAYNPVPSDSAKYIATDVTLSWTSGYGAIMHVVYFGDDFDTVSNAENGVSGVLTTYTPGQLELGKVYYWRVDELDGANTYKGDVWSFRTIPEIPINDPNLVGWWKFDEGAGATALDFSGHSNHAMLMGDPEWIAGYDGGALKFDGNNDYAVLPIGEVISSMSSATFATWVNFSNVGGAWQRIFDFGSGTGNYIFLCPRTGVDGPLRLAITIGGGAGESLIDSSAILPSGWHHVAAVISLEGMQIYLDGAVIASGTTDLVPSDLGQTSSNWLGRSQYPADAYFNGSLDDFRIYDYALTADEIAVTMRGDPLLAWNAQPADGSTPDIQTALPLSWSSGEKASQHDVYFGTDAVAVDNADTSTPEIYRGRQAANSYTPPEGVEWGGGPYYWRIDEVNTDGTISRGRVWSFTVADFILIDDFESYDAGENQVWYSWHDGLGYGAAGTDLYYAGNGTGAAVGDETTASYMEETIVHSGGKSLPFFYDNNKQGYAKYSETELILTSPRDWTMEGVEELSLWFRGYPASVGSFVEAPVGTYTMTGSGADIWGQSDQFHYAFKTLAGPGSIAARVESLTNTNSSAKAAVMIRETLDADSKYLLVALTPGNGVIADYRFETGGSTQQENSQTGIVAPYWVKIERDFAGNITAYSSADGSSWQVMGQPIPFQMSASAYIGLAVTAHNANLTCEAKFSNVTITGNAGQAWMNQDIGIQSNNAEPLYVAVSNTAGNTAVVVHDNPDAVLIDTWTEWVISLQTFADQGINLNDLNTIAIGLGTRGNTTTPGGAGKMYIDDIRLYRSRGRRAVEEQF